MSMKQILQAAIAGGGKQPNRSHVETKDDAKGLADALQRGRKKFLEEHPEAGDRQYYRTPKAPSKKKEQKELKKKSKEIRKQTNVDYTTNVALNLFTGAERMSYPNYSFTMADFEAINRLDDYYPGDANFARTKGAKDKRKRRGRTAALVGAGLTGAAGLAAAARYGGAARKAMKTATKRTRKMYAKKGGVGWAAAKRRFGQDVAAVKSAPGRLYEGAKRRVRKARGS